MCMASGCSWTRVSGVSPRCSPIGPSLSRGQGFRSFRNRSFDRRPADGPLGPRGFGRDVFDRHGNRVPRRRADQRRVRTGRECRSRFGRIPDEFYVFKPTLRRGFRPILQRQMGNKEFKLVYDVGGGRMTRNVPVPPEDRSRFAINDEEILTLARWACLIEDHYSKKRGRPTPMDIEWAKDGVTGELFIVQARPETVQSQSSPQIFGSLRVEAAGRRSSYADVASASGSARGRCASSRRRRISSSSRREKCWSPTRPTPTGSRR